MGTSNFINGKVSDTAGKLTSVALENELTVQGDPIGEFSIGQDVCISVRPEQVSISRNEGDNGSLPVVVQNRIFLGEHTEYLVKHKTPGDFLVLSPRQSELSDGTFNTGDSLHASWDAGSALVLDRD